MHPPSAASQHSASMSPSFVSPSRQGLSAEAKSGRGGGGGSWERLLEVMGTLDENAALDREMLRHVRSGLSLLLRLLSSALGF